MEKIANMEQKSTRGGVRPGSGRPATDRRKMLSVRISEEAHEMISEVKNKSEYIDTLIKRDNEQE